MSGRASTLLLHERERKEGGMFPRFSAKGPAELTRETRRKFIYAVGAILRAQRGFLSLTKIQKECSHHVLTRRAQRKGEWACKHAVSPRERTQRGKVLNERPLRRGGEELITAKGVAFKRGGKKETETNKARKIEKVKVTFTLGENKMAKPGEKTVFVRIMTPDGKEMAKGYDDNYKFVFNQSTGYFAGKETLNYANTEITGVTYCEGQGEYVPGTYLIEVTCDGVVIGNSSIKLD